MAQVKKVIFSFIKYDRLGDDYYEKVMDSIDDDDIVLLQLDYVLRKDLAKHNISGAEAKEVISMRVLEWTT
jgi:hypothetical protein